MLDALRPSPHYNESVIVNLDTQHSCGTHWVACNKYDTTVKDFDSLGL